MPKMPYNGTAYWIGFHREYGLLLYAPGAPDSLGVSHVYLFDVSRAAFRAFPRSVAGSTCRQEPWSGVDEHRRKDMARQVGWYNERKEVHRALLWRQLQSLQS